MALTNNKTKSIRHIRDIDVYDDNVLLGTIKAAKSYSDAICRSKKELILPSFTNYGYEYRNTFIRTGKWLNND